MYRAVVCTTYDDGRNGISEYRREAVGEPWLLPEKRNRIYSDAADPKTGAWIGRCAGGAAGVICNYIYRVSVFVQNLSEACAGVSGETQ